MKIYFLLLISLVQANYDYLPQQIHISYTNHHDEMMITWSTLLDTNVSTVRYSKVQEKPILQHNITSNNIKEFIDGGELKRVEYIHRVLLTNLEIGEQYYYVCGSVKFGWSNLYKFTTMNDFKNNTYPKLIFYGDLGDTNSVSLASIQEYTEHNVVDAILHIGDFAYNLYDDNGIVGDRFMNDIQSLAANIPYMTAVGNHEYLYNFSHYKNRFTMPDYKKYENMYYSWDIGKAHIISLSTEFYYFFNENRYYLVEKQYQWLENDLFNANLPENRKKHPWIITMGHRPFYCSNRNIGSRPIQCTLKNNTARLGLLVNNTRMFGLEELLIRYNVDIELWGHQHSYERLYPIDNYKVFKKNVFKKKNITIYYRSSKPVQIISGSPGCNEDLIPFLDFKFKWSAFRSETYGYGHMSIYNSTNIEIKQIDGKNNNIIDNVIIIK